MTDAEVSLRHKRHTREWIALIAIPVLLNVALALYLFGPAKNGNLPGSPDSGQTSLPLPGEIGEGLPQTAFARILADVRERTGRIYSCEGAWRASDGTIAWSCREHDSLAILRGFSPALIFAVEVTWFGFDVSATDLPAWAAAAFRQPEEAREAVGWVVEHGDRGDAATTIDGVQLRIGGARGALTLDVSR